MGRWQPDARGRLALAAMQLYVERGFEQTTVAEIAERAGLSERTFFRHFVDKREVLFGGQAELRRIFVTTVAGAPANAAPLDAVESALYAAAAFFEPNLAWSRERQGVIVANPALQERELIKRYTNTAAIAEALRERGVTEPTASLAAESGVAVFHLSFERWVERGNTREFAGIIRESLAVLRSTVAL